MLRKITVPLAFLVAITAAGLVLAAGPGPTPSQIYQATESGHIAQAEQLVGQALAEHPKSGKAHYIAAEVYARAGDFTTARHELATAESLEPGLPFANARSVAQLRAQLSQGRTVRRVQYAPYGAPAATRRSSVPWGLILVGLSIVVIVWSIARRRRQMAGYSQYPGQGYPGQAYPGQPMGMPPGGVAPPMGGYPYGYGGGSGSGLMGSLGTGLAVGAGVAAGEALVGKMLGGGQGGIVPPANAGEIIEQPPQTNEDMGWADFGTSGDSWDDGSGGGGGGGADFGTGGDFGGGGDSWT